MPPKRPREDDLLVEERPRKRRRSEDDELALEDSAADGSQRDAEEEPTTSDSDDSDIEMSGSEAESDDEGAAAPDGSLPGHLRSITLENFMCHNNLRVDFSPKINFLTGPNGSGKSAVLVAIVIGLGAKTSSTGRGRSLDSFVMNSKNTAKVTTEIHNQGAEAFNRKKYGKTIIVERTLRKSGGGSFKVMDTNRNVVATSKAEVTLIVEHFNLQVDNPCAILMQDTSRQYLSESTPQTKYKFFLIGTQLQKIKEGYGFVKEQNDIISKLTDKKKEHLPLMEQTVIEAKQEYEKLKSLRDLADKLGLLKDKLSWMLIKEKEDEVAKLKDIESKLQEKLAKVNARLKKVEGGMQVTKNAMQSAFDKSNELREEGGEAARAKQVVDRKVNGIKRRINELNGQIKNAKSKKASLERRLGNVQEKIRETKEATNRTASDEERRLLEAKAEIESEMNDLQKENEVLDRKTAEVRQRVNDAKDEQRNKQRFLSHARSEANKAKESIATVSKQKQNRALIFGRNTITIHELINKNGGRFSRPPIGPLGMVLKLKDPKWALAVETALGRAVLSGYVVSNHADERALKRLLGERRIQVPMLFVQAASNDRYFIDPNTLPPSHLTTVMDMVEISDPWAFNVMVDQTQMQRKVLMERESDARALAHENPDLRVGPVYLPNGAKVFQTRGSRNFVPCRDSTARMISVDFERAAAAAAAELHRCQADEREAAAIVEEANRQVIVVQREGKSFDGSRNAILRKERDLRSKLQNVEDQLAQREEPADISEMEMNADKLRNDIAKIEEEVSSLKEEVKIVSADLEDTLRRQESTNAQIGEIEHKTDELEEDLRALGVKDRKLQVLLADSNDKLAKVQQRQKENQQKLLLLEEEISAASDRITVTNSRSREEVGELDTPSSDLDQQITRLEADLKANRDIQGRKTVDEALRDATKLKRQYKDTIQALESMESFTKRITHMLDMRVSDWNKMRSSNASMIKRLFLAFLSRKGHTGKVKFSHKDGTLDLTVQLEMLSTKQTHQSTNSLSGGERSYTTVSLLMSLWHCMTTAFTAMDEFDVFMDQVTRKKSVETLLEFARQYSEQQYIFITPQSLTGDMGDDVRVTRMTPPER